MKSFRIVILDDDYQAYQSFTKSARRADTKSLVYKDAESFYSDLCDNKFDESDLFILDLMLRNVGLPASLLNSGAQTGQVLLSELRGKFPTAVIYVVTAWNLRSEDPHHTAKYADKIYSKPCKYRHVIQEILREANDKRGS